MATKDWGILVKRNTLSVASSAEAYALPNDFDRFVDNTHWNLSNSDIMDGPISRQRWQSNKSGLVTITVNDRWQVRADGNDNRIHIDPIPTSAEQISYFYVTNTWCRAAGGDRQCEWLADDDELLLPLFPYELELKWRFLRALGRTYADEFQEAQRELNRSIAKDGGLPTLNVLGVRQDLTPPFVANIPETGFG